MNELQAYIFIGVVALSGMGIAYFLHKIYRSLDWLGCLFYEHYDRTHEGWMEPEDVICDECREKIEEENKLN